MAPLRQILASQEALSYKGQNKGGKVISKEVIQGSWIHFTKNLKLTSDVLITLLYKALVQTLKSNHLNVKYLKKN